MTVLQYNTVPAEHQPLVAEAPKKSGRVGALARTDAKAGKQYNAGAIRVVDCVKDVSPQYQLTEWLQV